MTREAAHVALAFFLFFLIEQEVFIGPTNKHLGVVVGLGQGSQPLICGSEQSKTMGV